ncbi:MAG: MAPEG family protein [Hyphomonadaceae bacterium]|nr:MAPEG family protein [Hyphomonadaceae bacterium]
MVRLEIAAIYAGVNILLLLALAVRVAGGRRRGKIVLGDGDADFLRVQRAHGNAAEYIPAGIAGLTLIALLEPAAPLWLLHAAGASLTGGRILHAVGLAMGPLNAGRVLGITLTWLAFLLIGGGLIYAGAAQQI